MKCAAVVSFAILFGSTILPGQTASKGQAQIVIQKSSTAPDGSTVWTTQTLSQTDARKAGIRIPALTNSCPVSLRAKQAAAAFARQVNNGGPQDNGTRPRDIAQRLHLSVTSADSRRVVAANVTVRGFANKGRFVETMSTGDNTDAAKTFDVQFRAGPEHEISTELWVPGLSAVRSIDLNSITYDDGSTWKLAAGGSCSALVDGVMLIGGR
jgi:hypothetical protein